jgi:maleylacetate reductase
VTTPFLSGFIHATRARRVVFGPGSWSQAGEELDRLEVRRALVVTTPRGAAAASDLIEALGSRVAGVFSRARLHVPEHVVRAARDEARKVAADGLLASGGGSAVGVAKAVALETRLPILALPTTYSGSEMTAIWGMSSPEGKRTGRDEGAAPRTVVYDPARTLELPPDTSAASGINALAHGVEALYAHDGSPLSGLLAEAGIRALARSLPRVVTDPGGLEARSEALYGAHFTGWALDLASMGLHHKLCHVLGGTFDLPHALVHALVLPHVVAYNEPAAPEAMARVSRAIEAKSAPLGLHELNGALGIQTTLRDLGLDESDLDRVAGLALEASYPNPRTPDREGVRALLQGAWEGRTPE